MKLLSISEAGKILNKSRQWIWILIISKRLAAQKVGKSYVISEEELNNYTNNNTIIYKESNIGKS